MKIVNGIAFEAEYVENAYVVKTFKRNGVMERSLRQMRVYKEVGVLDGPIHAPHLAAWDPTPEQLSAWEAEKAIRKAQKREQNAAAAKTACRRIIIAERFNELLTLTYRQNQGDRRLCKKHFKEWVRRMRRALPSFKYCASFERQERGAMHVHLATHKLPEHAMHKGVKIEAWKLGTKVWRSVVGEDNGMCFVGGKVKFGSTRRRKMSLAKMAAYVSKYIMKDWEDVPDRENRYSHSEGTLGRVAEKLKPETLHLLECSYLDAIALCFELGEGDTLHSWSMNALNGSMWLVTENETAAIL